MTTNPVEIKVGSLWANYSKTNICEVMYSDGQCVIYKDLTDEYNPQNVGKNFPATNDSFLWWFEPYTPPVEHWTYISIRANGKKYTPNKVFPDNISAKKHWDKISNNEPAGSRVVFFQFDNSLFEDKEI